MDKKTYKVLHPIGWGGRVERGEIIELTDAEFANFGPGMLEPTDEVVTVAPVNSNEPAPAGEGEGEQKPTDDETKGDEKALDDMSIDELTETATALNLDVTGSRADLIERITLARG